MTDNHPLECTGENSTHTYPNICQDSRKAECPHYWERKRGDLIEMICLKRGLIPATGEKKNHLLPRYP